MATPGAVATFVKVTGAPSSVAIQNLEEHGGNRTDAVNGHFLEEDTHKLWSQEHQNLAASASHHDNPGASNEDLLAQSSASHVPDAENEEEIVEAAMQDSKADTAGASSSQQMDILHDSSDHELPQSHSQRQDDYDLACAVLMSLKDAEYLESLLSDKQKELNNKAESHSSKEEESFKKMLEEKELGEMLDKKEVRLPKEPPLSDEVITIIVRMPEGCRCEGHFLKTDKLEDLFDFVNIAGFKESLSGTCRLVKQFPRRDYNIEDSSSTFDEVGLSNNETLYVEKI